MARVMEIFVAVNALFGIMAFLGIRIAWRKGKSKIFGEPEVSETNPAQEGLPAQKEELPVWNRAPSERASR